MVTASASALFDEIKNIAALDCPDGRDSAELIHIAEKAAATGIPLVSAGPESVEALWTWLEKKPAKILARFFLANSKSKSFDLEREISALSRNVNGVLKKGASGAQVFVPPTALDSFVNGLLPVRDGLFFNKDLAICLDMTKIDATDWPALLGKLKKIRADAMGLYLPAGKKGPPDFVGRVYGLLESLDDSEFGGELHFLLGDDFEKIEQVWRLANKMRPDAARTIRFFIGI
jgi:hypothetical protein